MVQAQGGRLGRAACAAGVAITVGLGSACHTTAITGSPARVVQTPAPRFSVGVVPLAEQPAPVGTAVSEWSVSGALFSIAIFETDHSLLTSEETTVDEEVKTGDE